MSGPSAKLKSSSNRYILDMQILRPRWKPFVTFIHETAIVAQGLQLLASFLNVSMRILTRAPFGPSLTAQTAEPCTKQCEHRHACLSLCSIISKNPLHSHAPSGNTSRSDLHRRRTPQHQHQVFLDLLGCRPSPTGSGS